MYNDIELIPTKVLIEELLKRTRNSILALSLPPEEGNKHPQSCCYLNGSPTELIGLTHMITTKVFS